MSEPLDDNPIVGVCSRLPAWEAQIRQFRETLLANLVMLGEIPSPTYGEQDRIEMLIQRFVECGLQDCATDDTGNGLGIVPGRNGERNILIVAHADTLMERDVDHTVVIRSDAIAGAGLADNSLGMAVLATLPTLLERLDIQLDANLILMGAVKSLGHGNVEGLRFFLDHNDKPIHNGVCVEGVRLGRLNYSSIGTLRGEVTCRLSSDYEWRTYGTANAIVLMNDVVRQILEIPVSQRPRTSITLGEIRGGSSFNRIATEAILRFEVQSEELGRVHEIGQVIHNICDDLATHTGATVHLEEVATRQSGGLPFNHPLPAAAREIQTALDLTPQVSPSVSELAAFIAHGIPALTVGISDVRREESGESAVLIEPISRGLTQLLGLLAAIDRGLCDES